MGNEKIGRFWTLLRGNAISHSYSHEEGNVSLTSPPFRWGRIISEHALLWKGVTHKGHTFNVPSPLLLQGRGQAGLLAPALVRPK